VEPSCGLDPRQEFIVTNQTVEEELSDTSASMVFVVDDDESIREAIAALLESVGLKAVLFAHATELLEQIAEVSHDPRRQPGCLILDVRMPRMGGLEVQERLSALHVGIPIIFVSAYGDVTMTAHAMKAGARDFLSKPFRSQEMLDAVEAALNYHRQKKETERVQKELNRRYGSLTPRERDIMRLISNGRLNKQIAWELGLSEITVKVNRAQLMKKMNARSMAELVKMEDKLAAATTIGL
jgi:FixJ family two-component response regulator